MSQNKTDTQDRVSPALILAVLGLSALILYRASNSTAGRDLASDSYEASSVAYIASEHQAERQPVNVRQMDLSKLDFFLKQAHNQQQLNALKTEKENRDTAHPINQDQLDALATVDLTKAQHSLNLENEKTFDHVVQDIDEARRVQTFESPEAQIQEQVRVQRFNADYDRAYSEQYVEQFKKNALKAGYKVQVNKDMEVVGVRRVKPLGTGLRLPQSVGSAAR